MTQEIEKALKCIPLLAPLPDACLQRIAAFSMLRSVRAGETIFCQGEPSPYCFGVVSGEVTIQRVPKDNRLPPKVLGVVGPGTLFGESSLFEESPRAAMASARQDGQLVAILGTKLREWIAQEPGASVPLLMGLLKNTMTRLQQTSGDLSVVYGLGRTLGAPNSFEDQITAALEFLRNSLDRADAVALYLRSAYWEEFEFLRASPASKEYPALPIKSALGARVIHLAQPCVLPESESRSLLSSLPDPWPRAANMAVAPLIDRENQQAVQGLLLVGNTDHTRGFSQHHLLLLATIAQQLGEAVSRELRQNDAAAQARLRASRTSYSR